MDDFFPFHKADNEMWTNMMRPTYMCRVAAAFERDERAQSQILCLDDARKRSLRLIIFYLHGNDFVLLIQWARWRWRAVEWERRNGFRKLFLLMNHSQHVFDMTHAFSTRGYPFWKSTRLDERETDTISVRVERLLFLRWVFFSFIEGWKNKKREN